MREAETGGSTLAALLCSRLCHDLVGPLNAVTAGLEILGEGGEPEREAFDLVAESAAEVARRLKFFRGAYGVAKTEADGAGLAEARALAQAFFAGGRITLDWPQEPGPFAGPVDGTLARIMLNMVLWASEALPRGGTLAVAFDRQAGHPRAIVRASGPAVRVAPLGEKHLQGHPAELDPSSVQARFLAVLAAEAGARLTLERPRARSLEVACIVSS